jgi:hypothetical protein
MNCENCKKEFQPTKTNGTIQKYCSLQCRNQAANTRRINKIIATHNGTTEEQKTTSTQEIENEQINRSRISGNGYNNQELQYSGTGNNTRELNFINEQKSVPNYDNHYKLIETNFNTKSELIQYQLKLEYANKEIEELKRELFQLELELDEKDSVGAIEPTQEQTIIQNLTKGFATDPIGILNFVKDLMKSKTNEAA